MKSNNSEFDHIDIFEIKNCLIIPIQVDLYDSFMFKLRKTILKRLSKATIIGVVIDLSPIKIVDSFNLKSLLDLCQTIELMGKKAVISGFRPSVAAVLSEFQDVKLTKLLTFIDLQLALNYLQSLN